MKENKDVPRGAPQKCPKCHTEARVILIQENDLPQDVIDLFMPLMQHLEDFYRIFQVRSFRK